MLVPIIALLNGLTVIAPLNDPGHTLYLVSAPDGFLPDLLIPLVQSTLGVLGFELDNVASLPESGASVNQSTVGILDGLSVRTYTPFDGQNWWDTYLNQPAAGIINLPAAQQIALGAGTVAVIDTGIDASHPALQNVVVAGYDFTRNQAGLASDLADLSPILALVLAQSSTSLQNKAPTSVNSSTVALLDQSTVGILDGNLPEEFGHGTMVAGLIHRVAPGAKLMPLKAFGSNGTGRLSDIVRAIYYAANARVNVINMSFSLTQPSLELYLALSYANGRNIAAVASVGNGASQTTVYPAGWGNLVEGVASTTDQDARSAFSNYGDSWVAVAAPGEGLITTYPGNNYAVVSGTSFSAALVSGGSALLVGINPGIKPAVSRSAMTQTYAIPNQGLGAGRIDLYQACGYALRVP
ncbi:MAG TPA: S8 family serine peptidase [Candidatus Acidoferrales bacterium]|nr:S8 family serine peptidase [Candidatus Acidoferrales bacterium]